MEKVRPNRSDVHMNEEEAAEVEAAARDYFDGVAPKRHTKPLRSEYSSSAAYVDAHPAKADDQLTPEYIEFQHLEKEDSQKLVYSGSKVAEEFTETQYYKDLNGVDKQHHTTGTGFIKVDDTKGKKGFSVEPDYASESHASCRGNPATNDWVPAASDDTVDLITDKPKRSG